MIPAAPRLRFPEFKDPWKPGHAGDAFKNSRAKGAAGLPIYSVTMDRGLVRRDSMDRHMAADAADGQNLRAQRGDVVYNMMRMWQGAVGLAPEECMVSPAYVVLSPKKHTSPQFFDQWFKGKRMLYLLGAYSHGITSDRLRLYADDFARIPLHLPSLPEQQKIAVFLGAVDAKLAALATKQAALGRFKAGLMQKLFSQQIRFKRDDGGAFPDWEELPFEKIASRGRSAFNPQKLKDRPTLIELENIESGTGKIVGHSDLDGQISLKSTFRTGDVLFGKLRPYLRKYARPNFDGVCSSEIWVLHGRKVSNAFLFYLVQSSLFIQVANISTGSKMPRSDWATIADTGFEIPHPDEQAKIADALSAMDAKIQTVADQLARLQTFKKGLLQQMFV